VKYKILSREEISKFNEIDRREVIEHIYSFRDGAIQLNRNYFDVPDWTESVKNKFIKTITSLFDRGGTVFGAFEDDKLVGLSTIDKRFLGKDNDLLNLNGLWVSRDYRGKGVATKLIDWVKQRAIERGAKGLYVSSTESKNTVEFYMNRGFELAKELDEELFNKEPKDIHMILRFSGI